MALGARSDLLLLDALTRGTGGDLVRADARDDLRGLVRELRLRAEVPVDVPRPREAGDVARPELAGLRRRLMDALRAAGAVA